ncbi:MAG: hypothetical protein EZS28_003699, partial [Streblomastix strix]
METINTKRLKLKSEQDKKLNENVKKWIQTNLSKDVDVPEGLRDGVAIIEALNHLKPGSIEKYEKTPKNIFSKATNI